MTNNTYNYIFIFYLVLASILCVFFGLLIGGAIGFCILCIGGLTGVVAVEVLEIVRKG